MKPIDGDMLMIILDDTEDRLRQINESVEDEAFGIYIDALSAAFSATRAAIDLMPILRTPMDYMER